MGHTIYPCVQYVLQIDYIGIYGKMCTWIIRCSRMIFPLMSSKYTQATDQSCWSGEFDGVVCNGDQVRACCYQSINILFESFWLYWCLTAACKFQKFDENPPAGSHITASPNSSSVVLMLQPMDRRWIKWNKDYLRMFLASFFFFNWRNNIFLYWKDLIWERWYQVGK